MRTNGRIQLFPLLRIAAFMALGIFLGYETRTLVPVWIWLAMLVAALMAALLLWKHDLTQGVMVCLSFFFLGGTLICRQAQKLDKPLPDGDVTYKAVVASQPQVRGKTLRMDLWVLDDIEMPRRVKAAVLREDTTSDNCINLQLGDGIIATSKMKAPENYYQSHFDYPLYLRCHGYTATTLISSDSWINATLDLGSLTYIERARLKAMRFRQLTLRKYLGLGLSDDEMAVAVAMALGDKTRITNDLRDIYSISGASHVLALSGLHLGIIYILLSLMVGMRRLGVLRELLIIAGIWSYALFTGLSPSVVRASVMITIYAFVGLLGRDRMSLNALAFTAIIMLMVSPLSLYDVGFQMSFMAVMAILIFCKPLGRLVSQEWLQRHKVMKWVWMMLVVSFSAQLGVAPLTAYYFGRFSTYFLLSNFFIIPLATIILYLTAIMFVTALIPPLLPFLAKALAAVVGWQNALTTWVASLPGSSIEGISLNRFQVLMIYIVIAATATIGYKILRLKNKL